MWLSSARSGFLSSKEGIPDRKLRRSKLSNFSEINRFLRILANLDFFRQAPDDKRKTGSSGAYNPFSFCEISNFFNARTGHKLFFGNTKRSTVSEF